MPEDPIQISTSPRVAADRGRRALALTPGDVFLIYFAMGGTEDQEAIYRFLNGDGRLSDAQFDVLAAALNDEFLDRGQDHPVPYSVDFRAPLRPDAPLDGDGLRPRPTGHADEPRQSGGAGTPASG